ncbi:MAG: Ldh family oxidoreductase [Chloroflexi bacterium]|nr:Ldh family oxidoreductase [Chloroflexota bacterium]
MYDANKRRVPVEVLTAFTRDLLERHGMSPEHADIMTANLVEADMRGVTSHGHWLLQRYSGQLDTGEMNPQPNVRVVRETAATVLVDGDFAPGHVAGALTMRAVIEKAREAGTATGITRRSRHFGAAAHFALMAVPHDMAGYATTNAGPTMFAFGGRERVVGNNPIAYAIPAGRERPLVLDMAMSMSANSRIAIFERLGQQIPEGWALDNRGLPTTDPIAFADNGAGAPIGGPKGIGLAQVVDAMTGVLSGSGFSRSVGRVEGDEGAISHLFQATDIGAFMPVETFKSRMDAQIEQFKGSARADGVEELVVAGELEWRTYDEAQAEGVALLEPIIADLNAVAARKGAPTRL